MPKTPDFVESSLSSCLNNFLSCLPTNYKKSFTLAEVLVTLTIIGVVCALIIPPLKVKHDEQVRVAKVKNFYSNLKMTYDSLILTKGSPKYWGTNNWTAANAEKLYESLFEPYFKIEKACGVTNEGNCITNEKYKTLSGKEHNSYGTMKAYYKILLKDGSQVWFRGGDPEDLTRFVGVYYDVNGSAGPNQAGVDLFDFQGRENTIEPNGLEGAFDMSCTKDPNVELSGFTCTSWVIYKGNMEYLHCDDLKWDGKQKCGK